MAARLGRPGGGGSPADWFNDMPPISKVLMCTALGLSTATSFGLLSPYALLFSPNAIIKGFELWRMFTPCIFFGNFSFPFLIQMYLFVTTCLRYEQNPFDTGARGTSSDMAWLVVLAVAVLNAVMYTFHYKLVTSSLMFTLMYVWSRREPDAPVSLFMFKFTGIYLPWVYIVFDLLTGKDFVMPLIGIAVGHLYYFLVVELPGYNGTELIKTPSWFTDFVSWSTGAPPPAPLVGGPQAAQQGGGGGAFPRQGHVWGRGRVLGSGAETR